MGSQYLRRDHSFNLSICILRSIKSNTSDSLADPDLLPVVMWMVTAFVSVVTEQGNIDQTLWGINLLLTSLATTMTVNALATGLLVFRILRVFRQVKSATTSDQISVGITGDTKLRSIIFVIIESGMALFVIQLARVLITIPSLAVTVAEGNAFQFIVSVHEMLNVVISSVIATLCLLITSI